MSPQAAAPRRRLSHDERRRQILDAARRLFSERNYGSVSLAEVAAEAGVARGLLHHYFGGKRELYLAVVREMMRGGQPPVPEFVAGATPRARLEQSIDGFLDTVSRNRQTWFAALGAEGLGEDPEVEEILERVRESAVDNIIAVLGLGPAAKTSPQVRAVIRAYGGLAEATTRQWLQRTRLTRAQAHTLLTEALVRLTEEVLPRVQAAPGPPGRPRDRMGT